MLSRRSENFRNGGSDIAYNCRRLTAREIRRREHPWAGLLLEFLRGELDVSAAFDNLLEAVGLEAA